MIGYLKGKVIDKVGGGLVVEVGGVGYRVHVGEATSYKLQATSELWIHTYVREDQISLYGFGDKEGLKLFEMLIGVSGVGPKVAMAILGAAKAEAIHGAIVRADVGFFTRVPGIGKKGAQKIIIELKNKLGSVVELDLGDEEGDEVAAALVGMGYDGRLVGKVLRSLGTGLDEEEKLRQALKKLGVK